MSCGRVKRYQLGAHTKHDLKVHLVWIPKYRKKVLTGQVALCVRGLIRQIATEHEIAILSGSVRRTLVPKGQTPVLIHAFNGGKISVAAALAYRWDGKRSRLYFQTRPGSSGKSQIAFLEQLRRHSRGQQMVLVGDGLPAHKSRIMQAYLQNQRHGLREERLPGYAPDLNPVEMVWGNIKGQELANRCSANLAEAATAVTRGMARVRRQAQQLAVAFLDHAGLSF